MNTTIPSRLVDRSGVPSIHTFGELSNFLRNAIADEDSRILSESMGDLAAHADAVVAALRLSRDRAAMAPLLMDMLDVLRAHRNQVLGLGLAWRGLYEYAGYLQALNNFRVLIGQWLQAAAWEPLLPVTAEDFELVAWRTMGEGMLLIDMYDQWLGRDAQEHDSQSGLGQLTEPQVERAVQWWQKLRR